METRQLLGIRPHYYRGQLLLEDDFIGEQHFHAQARRGHTLNLHGWGVAWGLEVTAAGETAVSVGPGFAVDGAGHEIALREAATVDLARAQGGEVLFLALSYEDEPDTLENEETRSRQCHAVLRAAASLADDAVLLATLTLDARGRLGPDAIDGGSRRRLPGAVRRGWVRTPFRPLPLLPDKEKPKLQPPPAFLVGATRAQAEEGGAGGTMAMVLPPEVNRVHRLRIAGEDNAKGLRIQFWIAGWNAAERKHAKRAALTERIEPEAAFDQTFEIAAPGGDIDPELGTMSIEIHSEGRCFISLIAVEVSFPGHP